MTTSTATERAMIDLTGEPAGLRTLDHDALERLAAEIRQFLVDSVARTGGHLGSNLGVVELTLALHRVFDSPTDSLVWDTGHQAYVHKIVTGRQDRFAVLRRPGGLSGYPSRTESEHDLVENSHASTALSHAHGLATARDLKGATHHVVAIVGDGALTGGLAYEALNNLGVSGRRVLVVLNDNGRSYAPTRSRLSVASSPRPVGEFFGALGLDYLGPIDGHDFTALEDGLRQAASKTHPVVLHVLTKKGKGYEPAERDDEKCLHDTGPFDAASGVRTASASLSYTEAFGRALTRLAAVREEVVAITAAMPGSTGLLPFASAYPDRFFDVGIAEQHAVTMAAGLAMGGMRPVVAIYSAFLNRAWDQIYSDVGLHGLPVVFAIDRAGVTGDDGPSHHGVMDLSLFAKVPGATMLAPSCYDDIAPMLEYALSCSGPVAIRWPKTAAPDRHLNGFATGAVRARRLRTGRDVCFLGVGKLVGACEEAAALLQQRGLTISVWDVQSVVPLDTAMIGDALKHALVVTVEDGVVHGGAGSLLARAIGERAAEHDLEGPSLEMRGLPSRYLAHGHPDQILRDLGLDGPGLARVALERWPLRTR